MVAREVLGGESYGMPDSDWVDVGNPTRSVLGEVRHGRQAVYWL